MCQSCIDIDKRIEKLRDPLLRPETDAAEVDRVHRLIYELYGQRARLHHIRKSSEAQAAADQIRVSEFSGSGRP